MAVRRTSKKAPPRLAADATVVRPLDQMELAYAHFARDLGGSEVGGLVIGLEQSSVTLKSLRTAMRTLEQRHPLLRCVARDGHIVELGAERRAAGCVDVKKVMRADANSWRRAWEQQRGLTPLVDGATPFEVRLFNGDDGACEIMVTGHHVFGDGQSLMNLCDELLQSLAHPERKWADREWAPSFEAALLLAVPSLLLRLLLRLWFFFETVVMLGWRFHVTSVPFAYDAAERKSRPVSAQPLTAWASLEPAELAAVKDVAKREGVSVNALLCAAAAGAVADVAGETEARHARLSVTADLRRGRLGALGPSLEDQDLGNYATAVTLSAVVLPVRSPAFSHTSTLQAARTLHLSTRRLPRITPLRNALMQSTVMDEALRVFPATDYPGWSAVIGNLGLAPLRKTYAGVGQLLFVRPMINFNCSSMPYLCFLSSPVGLQLAVVLSSRCFAEEQAGALLEALRSRLLGLLHTCPSAPL